MMETKESNKQTMVTYFIMPLLQLNKSSFGADNFINSYLDKNGYLVVNVKGDENSDYSAIERTEYFITDYRREDGTLNYIFAIPDEYHRDMELFIEGRYSQLSAKAKVAITKTQSSDSFIVKMLNPQIADKQKLADELHVNVDLIKEIKSPPSESNFINIK
jgi:hypothetical protein